jgi:molybdenum cofactor cytidylyltransferase
VLLAAGLSSRFGRQKLLEAWEGEPLVRRAAQTFLLAGLSPVVAVVASDDRFREALRGLDLVAVENLRPELGMSRSIALGVAALPPAVDAALVGVADQPYLTAEAIADLCRAFTPGHIVVPRYGDHRGNPPIFDRRFFAELVRFRGDRGGQAMISAHPDAVVEVELQERMGTDLDRAEDWPPC